MFLSSCNNVAETYRKSRHLLDKNNDNKGKVLLLQYQEARKLFHVVWHEKMFESTNKIETVTVFISVSFALAFIQQIGSCNANMYHCELSATR